METKETLIIKSPIYNHEHGVTDGDVERANKLIKVIEDSRDPNKPQPGDILEITNKYGEYYRNAHIERNSTYAEGCIDVCEQAYVPFTSVSDKGTLYFSTSGGSWPQIPIDKVKLIGKRVKEFCDWGWCGATGNGAFHFQATVNVWEYIAEDRLHGDYSTKDWSKRFFHFLEEGKTVGCGYTITGDGIAFRTQAEYELWLRTYKGVEFPGNWNNSKVVFYYREIGHYISRDEWEKLDLPIDTRMCNGIIAVKVKYDDEKHTIDAYRFTNDGRALWDLFKPYEYDHGNNNNFQYVIKKILESLKLDKYNNWVLPIKM